MQDLVVAIQGPGVKDGKLGGGAIFLRAITFREQLYLYVASEAIKQMHGGYRLESLDFLLP